MHARRSAGAQGLQPRLMDEANNFKNDYDSRGRPISCPFATVRAALAQSDAYYSLISEHDGRALAPVDRKTRRETHRSAAYPKWLAPQKYRFSDFFSKDALMLVVPQGGFGLTHLSMCVCYIIRPCSTFATTAID